MSLFRRNRTGKDAIMRTLAALLLGCFCAVSAHAVTNTNVVAFALLKVAPEKYKNKHVVYTDTYGSFLPTFPPYVEASGFKNDKWFILLVGDPILPVLFKKTDTNSVFVSTLKAGSSVKVTGRVRAFRVEPKASFMPTYYVDADAVGLESEPNPLDQPPDFRKQQKGPLRGGPPRR